MTLFLLGCLSPAFANTCATHNAEGAAFFRATSVPNGMYCSYQDSSKVKVKETPGANLQGPWNSSGWSAWCGAPDHTNASLCIFS